MRAVLEAKDMRPTPSKALEYVREIVGNDEVDLKGERAVYTFYYVVQKAIRTHLWGEPVEGEDLLTPSIVEADKLLHRLTEGDLTFVRATLEDKPRVDAAGNPKKKKGAKQELAAELYQKNKDKDRKEIIQIFVDEIGMSKAGATTYFYNMRKQFGE
jgi:hypothetical protein